ncbi:hypothetical protein EPUS_05718 [Endocarpon pusillum Z07020]|uniref:Uncharacterized protein n=1 Tax=Endocarpon pusillum (strain Z07020 / HMAS-L-300199) TaxID=1263415 RepID=U1FV37_ENDPU|nr:uncharacterized protein EPUS_05718 [Endocarpon pusillum Z07020]ERF68657.1 hypothetical protein EPUS_05718 [Endocarpon pusillum Z07020]
MSFVLWIIILEDIPREIFSAIQEEYSNSRQFCDGDIYRSLRHHQLNRNINEAGKWQARLSASKRKDVRQLHERYPHLTEAFDSLLPVIGLWAAVEIGTFHRILTLRCPEVMCNMLPSNHCHAHIHQEMVHYLHHVGRIWRQILSNEHLAFVDPATVAFLETLAPKFSTQDSAAVRRAMHDRVIFPQISREITRGQILNRILETPERIPSLFTFFEDTKYLEPCAKALKFLLPPIQPRSTSSLRDTFSRHFSVRQSPSIPIQKSEQVYASLHVDSPRIGGWLAYRQLWLFAMRHFPDLTDTIPRKDLRKPKPTQEGKRSSCIRFQLADLAHRLGYNSEQIHALRDEDPDRSMARTFLSQIRPTDIYDFSEEDRAGLVEHICEEIRRRSSVIRIETTPAYTTDEKGQPKSHRCGRPFEQNHRSDQPFLFCGRPFEQNHRSDQPFLFLGNIYGQIKMQRREHLTSFAFTRDIFMAFFGDNEDDDIFPESSEPPEDAPASPAKPSSHIASPSAAGPSSVIVRPRSENQDRRDSVFMASGFNSIHATRNACEIPTSSKASNIIQDHLKAINSTSQDHIILYCWRQQEYIVYDSESEFSFYSKVKDLTNKHFWFAVIKTPEKIKYVSMKNAWQEAQKYKVVFAGLKGKGGDYNNLPFTGDDLDHFLNYIDHL